jgi:methionyl-tRNA synthetase
VVREIRFGEDGDFSLTRLEQRYVSELSNELGNLMYRVLSMSEKYCDGKVPTPGSLVIPLDTGAYMAAFEKFELHQALEVVWNTVRASNKLIDDYKPWELAKTDTAKVHEVMYALLDALARVAHTLSPFCPVTADKILVQLGLSLEEVVAIPFEERILASSLPEGTVLVKGDVLFPRLS